MSSNLTKNNNQQSSDSSKKTVKKYVLKKNKDESPKFKINYEEELNKSQYQAVITTKGPVLVIAGAGTGKTRTLVYRVARLVEMGINPEEILLLTFTRKSAQEMLNRASAILDSRCENISGGTFHSFANILLRKYSNLLGLKGSFVILDRSDAEDIMNLMRTQVMTSKKQRFPRKGTLCDIYSKAVNKNISIAEAIEQEYSNFSKCTDQVIAVCQKYVEYKRNNSLLDYDDLLLYLRILLTSNEAIRTKVSNAYKYIMIDEYQDTNTLQAEIIQLLAFTHNNVLAVGDDAQSIYSFRGANFRNIMDFPQLFQNTKIIKLEENYRSTQEILDVTNEIIRCSTEKYAKKLYSIDKTGDKPAVIATPDQQTEAEFICQRVLELQDEDVSLNDISILARSSRATYALEIELNKKAIPFKKYGGFKFIDTAHIKDIISYLRLIVNKDDQISWNRVLLLINGIGSVSSTKLIPILAGDSTVLSADILPTQYQNKDKLTELIDLLSHIDQNKYSPSAAIEKILEYYHPILVEKYDDSSKREKDLDHFLYLSESYNTIESFLTDLALEPPDSSFEDVEGNPVKDEYLTISTIHSAKGLEWKVVFIMGSLEGRFPSIYSYNSQESLEEERRLMYVAATRAKQLLYFSYPIDMFDHSTGVVLSQPSRFIEKIDEDILEKWCLVEES